IVLYPTHSVRPAADEQARGAADALWSRVFHAGQKTNIVMADAARYEIQELLARDLSLRDYLSPEYPLNLLQSVSPELQRVIRFMGMRQTTSIASVATGTRFVEFGLRRGGNPVLRHPRHVNAGEFAMNGWLTASLADRIRPVEVLLKVRSIAGTAAKSEVVTVREVRPGTVATSQAIAR